MAQAKRRSSKARNTARRIVPFAMIAPGAAVGTYVAVSFVSSPNHLYNSSQLAAAAARVRAARAAEQSYLQVVNSLNESASQLAELAAKSASDQSGIGPIQSGISSIAASKPPTATSTRSSYGLGQPSASSGAKVASGAPIVPIAQVPLSQPPSATTSASMLAAG